MGMVDSRCSDGQDQESLLGVADHGDEDKDDDEMLDRLTNLTCFQLSFFRLSGFARSGNS